ncbi:MAG: hypothetical protein U1E66_08365 [Rhodospirillales bacterium]
MKKRLARICALLLMLSSGAADAAYPWDKDRGELQEIRVLVDERPMSFMSAKKVGASRRSSSIGAKATSAATARSPICGPWASWSGSLMTAEPALLATRSGTV